MYLWLEVLSVFAVLLAAGSGTGGSGSGGGSGVIVEGGAGVAVAVGIWSGGWERMLAQHSGGVQAPTVPSLYTD